MGGAWVAGLVLASGVVACRAIFWRPPASYYPCASKPAGRIARRLRAVQEIVPAQPVQGLGPVYPLDVFQEIEDTAPHVRLVVAPRAGTVAGDVDGQGALAPIAPLSGRRAAGRLSPAA